MLGISSSQLDNVCVYSRWEEPSRVELSGVTSVSPLGRPRGPPWFSALLYPLGRWKGIVSDGSTSGTG